MIRQVVLLLVVCLLANSASYSPGISRQMALYSEITYESEEDITSWSCLNYCQQAQAINPQTFFNSGKNTFGFTAYNPALDAIVVAFRGSTDIKNWMTNIDTVRTSFDQCDKCSVHLGFFRAYCDISA